MRHVLPPGVRRAVGLGRLREEPLARQPRLSIVGGGSVYPVAQNFCLALRDQEVATTFTTLLVAHEPAVKQLLGIPEEWATACQIVAGYPRDGFPKKLTRLPVNELAFVDTWGNALDAKPADTAVA